LVRKRKQEQKGKKRKYDFENQHYKNLMTTKIVIIRQLRDLISCPTRRSEFVYVNGQSVNLYNTEKKEVIFFIETQIIMLFFRPFHIGQEFLIFSSS